MHALQTPDSDPLPAIDEKELVPPHYSTGKKIPWWGKFASKLLLARLPVSHAFWRKLGLFQYGRSDREWSRERRFAEETIALATEHLGRNPRSVLELGPGDSLAGAIVAAANGTQSITVVDVGDFATVEVERYRLLIQFLQEQSPGCLQAIDLSDRDSLLRSINATYLTDGLASLKTLPSSSMEMSMSLKVMEHVRASEFEPLMDELSRVSTAQSLQRHVVDLHDHMGCRLNNLRFSTGFWEHPVVSNSGFYTNRLRYSQIVRISVSAGFRVRIPHALLWPEVPTPRKKMNSQFRDYQDEDLQVCMFDMILTK